MSAWRPNWRDPAAYPERMTEDGWRWQFLRRCADYQADFERHCDPKGRAREYEGQPLPEGVASWESHFANIADVPDSDEKYGVTFLLDPAEPRPAINMWTMKTPYGVGYASEESFERMRANHIKLMAFDLKQPIPAQIERARRYLERMQAETLGTPKERRYQRKKWARYLRVLDAKADGARAMDIVNALDLKPRASAIGFDPDRLVAETLNQARAVQLRFKGHP